MAHSNLVTFTNATATLLLAELPLQTLNSAIALVYAYISNVGGWLPDDSTVPQGPGQPANHFTEQQSADAITVQEYSAVYDIDFEVNVVVKVHGVANLTPGLSLNAAAASMAGQMAAFVTNTINSSPIPIYVHSIGSQSPDNMRAVLGGYTTPALRQQIQTDINNIPASKALVDHKAIAILHVRNTYGADNNWNVSSVFTQQNGPFVCIIQKYTNTNYDVLDHSTSKTYIINISPTSFRVVSGVIAN